MKPPADCQIWLRRSAEMEAEQARRKAEDEAREGC